MANIIEFGRKVQSLKSMKDTSLRQKKLESLKKIFQCTRCMMKCAKCGAHIERDKEDSRRFATPYPFCRNCQEEYQEYRERSDGTQGNPNYYWHNDDWMEVWKTWIEHQKSLDRYKSSKEFMQLVEEAEELLHP